MKKSFIVAVALYTLLVACTSQGKRVKEAEVQIEEEAQVSSDAEFEKWEEIKSLALKATGVTSSVKEERRLAYVKLIQIFPKSERWEDISRSIDRDELYPEYEDFLWEIKKTKGWTDFE